MNPDRYEHALNRLVGRYVTLTHRPPVASIIVRMTQQGFPFSCEAVEGGRFRCSFKRDVYASSGSLRNAVSIAALEALAQTNYRVRDDLEALKSDLLEGVDVSITIHPDTQT